MTSRSPLPYSTSPPSGSSVLSGSSNSGMNSYGIAFPSLGSQSIGSGSSRSSTSSTSSVSSVPSVIPLSGKPIFVPPRSPSMIIPRPATITYPIVHRSPPRSPPRSSIMIPPMSFSSSKTPSPLPKITVPKSPSISLPKYSPASTPTTIPYLPSPVRIPSPRSATSSMPHFQSELSDRITLPRSLPTQTTIRVPSPKSITSQPFMGIPSSISIPSHPSPRSISSQSSFGASRSIYITVYGIPSDMSIVDLVGMFGIYGKVDSISHIGGDSWRLIYRDPQVASKIYLEYDGYLLHGNRLRVVMDDVSHIVNGGFVTLNISGILSLQSGARINLMPQTLTIPYE
jgi:hypothetical protein